jgi:hypothetical protein
MIFKMCRKIAFFYPNYCKFLQKFDQNIGCWDERQFFAEIGKIADKLDYNIDPRFMSFYDNCTLITCD